MLLALNDHPEPVESRGLFEHIEPNNLKTGRFRISGAQFVTVLIEAGNEIGEFRAALVPCGWGIDIFYFTRVDLSR